MSANRLNDRVVKSLITPDLGNRITYDSEVKGFGVRLTAAGARGFVLNYRINGRERRYTIGAWPDWTTSAAREEAKRLKRAIYKGDDPLGERENQRAAPSVAELAADYLTRHAEQYKRPSSIRDDRSMLSTVIVPALGKLKVSDVRRRHIESIHHSLHSTPYRANRVLSLLSKMFALAMKWDWRDDNPVRGVQRYPEAKRDRWLSSDELRRLLIALDEAPNQASANAVRFLLLTGARRGEALSAKWEDIDRRRGVWNKPSHHTKQKRPEYVPLSAAALQLLQDMVKAQPDRNAEHYLFLGPNGQPLRDIKKTWAAACRRTGIENARLHDLRHTYASHLVSGGLSLHVVGRLLGHTQAQTTHRYAHLADDPLRQATNQFARSVQVSQRTNPSKQGLMNEARTDG